MWRHHAQNPYHSLGQLLWPHTAYTTGLEHVYCIYSTRLTTNLLCAYKKWRSTTMYPRSPSLGALGLRLWQWIQRPRSALSPHGAARSELNPRNLLLLLLLSPNLGGAVPRRRSPRSPSGLRSSPSARGRSRSPVQCRQGMSRLTRREGQ